MNTLKKTLENVEKERKQIKLLIIGALLCIILSMLIEIFL